jgi:para-aminobenzoate synthetase/4-amino-4-deoxychorismate lyase
LPAGIAHRLRVALSKDGAIEIAGGPLGAVKTLSAAEACVTTAGEAPIVGVVLAPECGFAPTRADDFLLRHKTTARAEYDRGWHEAEARGAFDMLFFNERGELTEGGRSNVFVKLDGQWWTPPLSAGLLPGVMRRCLLDDPQMAAGERTLLLADLLRAEAILVCNALRGVLNARVISAKRSG